MTTRTVVAEIASRMAAIANCRKSGNTEWLKRHFAIVYMIVKEYLPHGSGIDSGVTIIDANCSENQLTFATSYHHMNEDGYYDGWTEHIIRVYPAFNGIRMTISGRNRNDIKEYLHDVFYTALTAEINEDKLAHQITELGI